MASRDEVAVAVVAVVWRSSRHGNNEQDNDHVRCVALAFVVYTHTLTIFLLVTPLTRCWSYW